MKRRRLPDKRQVQLGGEEIKVGWRKGESGGGWVGSTLIGDGDGIKDDWREGGIFIQEGERKMLDWARGGIWISRRFLSFFCTIRWNNNG